MINRRLFLAAATVLPLSKPTFLSDRTFLEKVFGIIKTQSIFGTGFMLPYEIAYKVVDDNNNSPYISRDYSIHYDINHVARPIAGKIFVFRHLRFAMNEIRFWRRNKILKVKAQNLKKCFKTYQREPASISDLINTWNYDIPDQDPLNGSMICDAVIPIEEIT